MKGSSLERAGQEGNVRKIRHMRMEEKQYGEQNMHIKKIAGKSVLEHVWPFYFLLSNVSQSPQVQWMSQCLGVTLGPGCLGG